VVAHDGERLQPVFSLLSRDVRADLDAFLAAGERKIDLWLERLRWRAVDFSDQQEMFANVNTPADLAAASALLAKRP
jgi:molybdopterin-guanine dinucleotide biosynthesis protein A